ncbi:PR5-like receptor kinase [Cardamine amara subsp. amara]|uniref:PR5-like receptor kinase n=1 Tax=Cardamine amara subsp. amara TaxID=228776 RepID=A0ABD1C0H3_CARAN
MTERLPLFFLLASHLFVSGILSTSILTIENKCNNTIWPVLFSWQPSQVSTSGFALRSGEALVIDAPSSWNGLISARTLCSNSTGKFRCITGDCESGEIECPGKYSWAPVTYLYFKINDGGTNSYKISLEYGYNLPVRVSPSQSTSGTCMSSGCMVDLDKTCPDNLKKFSGGNLNACSSACQKSGSSEDCCTGSFKSKQTCKPSQYVQNFERACPSAYTYAFGDNNIIFTCSNTTNYVITFCPSSIPNITSSSMAPLPEPKDNSQRKIKAILGGLLAAVVVLIIIVVIAVVVRAKNARKKSVFSEENSQMRRKKKSQSYIPMISESELLLSILFCRLKKQ